MTPEQLRDDAERTEAMARCISFLPDRQWLLEQAKQARALALRLEERVFTSSMTDPA